MGKGLWARKKVDIIFNERRLQIFHELISNNSKHSINNMAEKFQVTERTIRYDLDEINLFFTNKGFPIFFGVENGIITMVSSLHDKSEIIDLINQINLNSWEYILSPKERKYIILAELFFAIDFITINYLSNKLKVSRNTIVNDLDKVKHWLINNQIHPIFVPSKGLGIKGEEKTIRKAILQVLREALSLEQYLKLIQDSLYYHSNSQNYSNILFNYLSKNINIGKVQNCIDTLQAELDIIFSDLVYIELIICLAINIQRIKLGNNIYISEEEKQEISHTKVSKKITLLSKKISKEFSIDFNTDEIIYLTQLILASNTITIPVIEDYPNILESQTFTAQLIAQVSKRLNNDFNKDKKLYDELSNFIPPFICRQKYNIPIYNPYLNEIQENYPKTFAAVKSSLVYLESNFKKNITDDEVGYITLYFAASLEIQNEFNILIVSGTGFSTANLLSAKLKSLFNINIVALVPISEVPEILDKHNVDLIVSTSTFNITNIDTHIPCVVVNPLLTQEDILLFRQYIKKIRKNKIERMRIL